MTMIPRIPCLKGLLLARVVVWLQASPRRHLIVLNLRGLLAFATANGARLARARHQSRETCEAQIKQSSYRAQLGWLCRPCT